MKKLPVLFALLALTVLMPLSACSRAVDKDVDTFWQAYTQRFIHSQGRVVDDSEGDGVTTSEGQAYALFFALVNNDRPRFEKLLDWTRDNLAQGDLGAHLPAWRWGKASDGQWRVLDKNSASDADLWLAYTLIQAGRLWKEAAYADLGRLLAARIHEEEVLSLPGADPLLLPGAHGFRLKEGDRINPSYSPLFLLQGLAQADPQGPWRELARALPALIAATAPQGFAPDWALYQSGQGFRSDPERGALGSYDAIRVYLWAGMSHPRTPGARRILHHLTGMKGYLANHVLPPEKINVLTGAASGSGPIGFSAALLPYLGAMDAQAALAHQRLRLQSAWNKDHLLGPVPRYYDQNLALFGWAYERGAYHFDPNGQLVPAWKKS